MEILKKEFITEAEVDRAIRIDDFKRKVAPYIKDAYLDKNNFYEDLYIAVIDNIEELTDIAERPF